MYTLQVYIINFVLMSVTIYQFFAKSILKGEFAVALSKKRMELEQLKWPHPSDHTLDISRLHLTPQ